MSDGLKLKALRYRWLIFIILSVGYVLVYFHRSCPAVLAVDIMKDLKTSGGLTGLLGAAYFYPYAVMQLPAGLLSDSWGARKTIAFFFMVAFAGSVLLGYAPNVAWAVVGRTLVGMGAAMLFVPTMKILAEWFRALEFARMMGILMAMGGVGSLSAAVPLVWLSECIGWRYSFVVVGVFTLFMALLVWVFVRNRPADFGWPSTADPVKFDAPPIELWSGVFQVLRCRSFWPLAFWFFCNCGVFFAFAGLWGGPFLQHVYGLSQAQSGGILSMIACGMIVGSPALSFLSDYFFKARKPVLLIFGLGLVTLTALLTFKTSSLPIWSLYFIYFFFAISASAVVVIGFTMNKELFPLPIAGTASGLINLFPFVGGAIFQPALGYILERHSVNAAFTIAGYSAAFRILFFSAIAAFVCALMTKETMRKTGPL